MSSWQALSHTGRRGDGIQVLSREKSSDWREWEVKTAFVGFATGFVWIVTMRIDVEKAEKV